MNREVSTSQCLLDGLGAAPAAGEPHAAVLAEHLIPGKSCFQVGGFRLPPDDVMDVNLTTIYLVNTKLAVWTVS